MLSLHASVRATVASGICLESVTPPTTHTGLPIVVVLLSAHGPCGRVTLSYVVLPLLLLATSVRARLRPRRERPSPQPRHGGGDLTQIVRSSSAQHAEDGHLLRTHCRKHEVLARSTRVLSEAVAARLATPPPHRGPRSGMRYH